MEPQLAALRQARPKYLMTVGGEPLLVPWLPEALRTLRQELDPWIVVTTNALVPPQRIQEIVPLVNSFVVSLDGIGQHNRTNRGVDSEKVLRNLRLALELVEAGDPEAEISVNVVVTRDSLAGLRALYDTLRTLSPQRLAVCFNPMTPYTDPLSVASSPETFTPFLDLVQSLVQQDPAVDYCGPGREVFHERQAVPCKDEPCNGRGLPLSRSGHHVVQCMRQFVWANLWPGGNLQFCNPHSFRPAFRNDIVQRTDSGRYWSALLTGVAMFDKLVLRPASSDCYHPCNCLPFLDDLINHREGGAVPKWTKWFRGRFAPAELDAFDQFLRRHYGRTLSATIRRQLLGQAQPESRQP